MTPDEQKTTDSVNEKLNSARNKADADHREEARLKVKADKGQASFTDANEYARVVGKQYGDAIRNLSGSELPNGQMGDTIANETLKPFLTEMTDTVKNYATDVMETAMKSAGIGLKPIVPYEADKVDGILKAAVKDKWDDIKDEVGDAAGTLAHKCVDDSIKANARFQYNAGMSPKIIRTATPGACKWCEDVAGEYEYQEVRGSGNDVFRRHANCDCIVEYVPRKGGKQVVSSSTYHQNRSSLTPEEREKRAKESQEFQRAISIRSETDLQRLSHSGILSAGSAEEAQNWLMNKYGFDVSFFDKLNAIDVKAVLAGYDDFLSEFPDAAGFIKSIEYDKKMKAMGSMNALGFSRIGKTGLKDYGTGLHEAAHALDFLLSRRLGKSFSDIVVNKAIKSAGRRSYSKSIDQIIGLVSPSVKQKTLADNSEIFAYSMETSMGGIKNDFANEVYKITKELTNENRT